MRATPRDELVELFGGDGADELQLRQATVTAIAAGNPFSATIRVGAASGTIAGVRSLVPVVVGDTVWCVRQDTDLVIVGHLDTGWHEIDAAGEPTFQNSWVNWGSGDATAAFRKIGGIVYLKGTIKSGLAGTIFTLPAGYRPAKAHYVSVATANDYGDLSISAAGVVTKITGSNVWFSLTTSFVAEQ